MTTNDQDQAELLETVVELASTLQSVDEHLQKIDTDLHDLADRVKRLEAEDEPSEQLTLEQWVEWLADTYYYRVRLKGWEDNAAMRGELEALKAVHDRIYLDTGKDTYRLRRTRQPAWDAVHWHDALARAFGRMGGDKGSHQDRKAKQPADQKNA